jgi:bifunctional UDP-N-acetylglucosamine pyrophosphorylase / glucosamine-1-phosphate N-acetyltransferase
MVGQAGSPETVVVVLAAGKGTRMQSALPKVLHRAAGRPLLAWVLEAAITAGCKHFVVVIGHGAEQVIADREIAALGGILAADGGSLTWALQAAQHGTGHALLQAAAAIPGEARLLVLSGDVPLVTARTLRRMLKVADGTWGAMAIAALPRPGRLGRVLSTPGKPGDGEVEGPSLLRIVEAADATPQELAISTVNAGLYVLPAPAIFTHLAALQPSNAQGELYLTDALGAAVAAGHRIELVALDEPREALGVNTRAELAVAHRCLIDRFLERLLVAGVSVLEPARTTVEATVCVGADTVIHADVSLFGRSQVGAGCVLHQGAWVRDSRIGDGVTIEPYSVLDGAEVASGCRVGPFAYMPPASRLQSGTRAGSFSRAGSELRTPAGEAPAADRSRSPDGPAGSRRG